MELIAVIATAVVALIAGATVFVKIRSAYSKSKPAPQSSTSNVVAIQRPGRHAGDAPPVDEELAVISSAVTAESAKHAA